MRPLFNKGVKPAQFANMLLELHTAEYDRLRLLHEYKIKSIRDGAQANAKIEPLSDPNRNRGVVFSSQYAQQTRNEVPTIKRTHDIIANLDIDEDVRPEDHYDYDDGFEEVKNGKPLGLQQSVVKLIQERLSEEVPRQISALTRGC